MTAVPPSSSTCLLIRQCGSGLQLGPIEDTLGAVHVQLVLLVCALSSPSAFDTRAPEARNLALRRLIPALSATVGEMRPMLLGLANLLKEPSLAGDNGFRAKVIALGKVVGAALSALGVAIQVSSSLLSAGCTVPHEVTVNSDDEFDSADECEEALPRIIPVPAPRPRKTMPTEVRRVQHHAYDEVACFAFLPQDQRELWKTVINADRRRQAAAKRAQPSAAYLSLGVTAGSKLKKKSALEQLVYTPEQLTARVQCKPPATAAGGASTDYVYTPTRRERERAAAPPAPPEGAKVMGGWHTKASQVDPTLSYEEQMAAQAATSRGRRRGRRGKLRETPRSQPPVDEVAASEFARTLGGRFLGEIN